MKITCNQTTLSKALNIVSKAVSKRTTIPILKTILLKAEDNNLILTASDYDLSIETKTEVNVEEEGSIAINARLFEDIIRKLPNESIEISTENGNVEIKTVNSEFNIVGQAAEEFPNILDMDEDVEKLSFDKELFRNMANETTFCASKDETKGVLKGILLEIEEEYFNMVSLDGYRMAVASEKLRSENSRNIIIAAEKIDDIKNILVDASDQEDFELVIGNKKAMIILNNTKVVLRLMEGEYIKYKEIIPKEKKTELRVEKNSLKEAIERASILSKEGRNNLVKFSITNNLLSITSNSEEGKVKEEVIIDKEGEDLEIGFNSKYILDALKVIEDEIIKIELNTSVTPCLLKPIEGNNFLYLILPVRISGN